MPASLARTLLLAALLAALGGCSVIAVTGAVVGAGVAVASTAVSAGVAVGKGAVNVTATALGSDPEKAPGRVGTGSSCPRVTYAGLRPGFECP